MLLFEPLDLIAKVKNYPVLYDQTNEHYHDRDYKLDIWKKIAKELNVEGLELECKKKWSHIRDALRKNRIRRKPGEVILPSMKYRYEDHLQFILPYYNDQPEVKKEKKEHKGPIRKSKNNEDDEKISGPTEIDVDDSASEDDVADTEESTSRLSVTPDTAKRSSQRHSTRKRKLLNSSEHNTTSQVPESPELKTLQKNVHNNNCHAVDAFLAGIAPSLKMLDPIRLIGAKSKIFNIVQEFELQQLNANDKRNSKRCKSSLSHNLTANHENETDGDIDVEVIFDS